MGATVSVKVQEVEGGGIVSIAIDNGHDAVTFTTATFETAERGRVLADAEDTARRLRGVLTNAVEGIFDGLAVRVRTVEGDVPEELFEVMVSVGPADAPPSSFADTLVASVAFRSDAAQARLLTWPDGEESQVTPWQVLAEVTCPACWPHDDSDCTCTVCDRTGLVPFPGTTNKPEDVEDVLMEGAPE